MTGVLLLFVISSYCFHVSCAWSLRVEIDFHIRGAVPSAAVRNKLVHRSHSAAKKPASQLLCRQWGCPALCASLFRCLGSDATSFSGRSRDGIDPQHSCLLARQKNTRCVHGGTISFVRGAPPLRIFSPHTHFTIGSGADVLRSPLSRSSSIVARAAEVERLRCTVVSYRRCTGLSKWPPYSALCDSFHSICTWDRRGYRKRQPTTCRYLGSKYSQLRALRCPLMNVVDLASMASPPLTAEEVLWHQEHSQVISRQMRMVSLAAKAAAAAERQRERPSGPTADSQQRRLPVHLARNLQNYRALLFFTSWDTLSQALVASLNDLASLLWPQRNAAAAATERQEHSVRGAHEDNYEAATTADTRSDCECNTEWMVLSEQVARQNDRLRRSDELSLILSRMIPSWLPIAGIRVYNSLVLSQGRRAIEKHKRMLTNRKQLRDHERSLLLMVNEGIHYGAGHMPTLQIWKVERGPFRGDDPLPESSSSRVEVSEPSRLHYETGDTHFTKVFEARGCGPIKLMELAGGNPEPWRIEEELLMKRALINQKQRPSKKESEVAGILSTGWGGWPSSSRLSEDVLDVARVWLAQLSTLYQYHALNLLLKRLSLAERQFPEFEEFNLRKCSLPRAQQKGLLSGSSK